MSKFYSLTSIFNKLPGILNPLYEAEKYTEEPKDIARIESMLSKSTDPEKLRQLAAKMVKSIKQKDKMVRRYKAALKVAGPDSPITQEFVQGCIDMGYTEIDIPELATADTGADNTPEPSEPKKDFSDATPDEKLKLAQAAAAKFNREQFENNALLNIGIDDDFDDMPLESLRKVHQLQAFLAQQLNDFNIQDKFKETVEAFMQNQKKYTIPDLKISSVTMSGTIVVSGTVQHKQRIKDSWGNYKSTPVNTMFTGAKYNVFTKGWDLDSCTIQEDRPDSLYRQSRSRYYRTYSSRDKDTDKISPLLNTLQKQFEKTIKYNKHVDRLFNKYQEIINRLFNDSYIEEFGQQGINIQQAKYTRFNRLIEYIIDRIEELTGFSDEPDHLNRQVWPGYNICQISNNRIYFKLMYEYDNSHRPVTRSCDQYLRPMFEQLGVQCQRHTLYKCSVDLNELLNALK